MNRIPPLILLVVCCLLSGCQNNSPIERAGRKTEAVLAEYQRSGNASPAVTYLLAYQGEAPGSQKMAVLAEWAIANRASFVGLVSAIPRKDRSTFLNHFCSVAGEFGLDASFKRAFQQEKSLVIQEILKQL